MRYRWQGALVGFALGFGAPLGILLLRFLRAGHADWHWIRSEISGHFPFYTYMAFATPLVFLGFGFFFGLLSDRVFSQKQFLEHQSMTDDITGLYNHRHLLDEVEREVERAKRYHRVLSGIMLDIDDFKKVNDRFGHLAGDSIIRQTADILRKSVRKVDILGRYGGDEFLVILPETVHDAARVVADRILANVRQHRFQVPGGFMELTASLGVRSFEDPGDFEKTVFIEKTDQALFSAKGLGKNRIYAK